MMINVAGYSLALLGADTIIRPFRSTDSDLNSFLLHDAKNYQKELLTVTYLLEDVQNERTVAYFSLLNDKLTYDPGGRFRWNRMSRLVKNSKRRKQYPAVKIGRLAVSEEYAGKGIGSGILFFVKHMLTHKNRTSCRFLTVDAYRSAVDFYGKAGFDFLTKKDGGEDTRLMYYDLMNFLSKEK